MCVCVVQLLWRHPTLSKQIHAASKCKCPILMHCFYIVLQSTKSFFELIEVKEEPLKIFRMCDKCWLSMHKCAERIFYQHLVQKILYVVILNSFWKICQESAKVEGKF